MMILSPDPGPSAALPRETSSASTSQELRKALQRAVESWGIGHWSWQIDCTSVEQDADLRRLFEWSVDSPPMPFEKLMDLVHPSDRARFLDGIEAAKRTGIYPDVLFRVVLPSGRLRWMLAKGQAIRNEQGQVTQLYGTSIDVTQSKQAEAARERAQKLEALGQLAGGVAHDFNNLLVAILGNMELAKETDDPKELRELIDEAILAASRARDLTGQLLAFGRRQPLKQRRVSISRMLQDTMRLLQRLLPENIRMELSSTHDGVAVLGDSSQLEQVIVNLCVNARDAMPHGGKVGIDCRCVPSSAGGAGQEVCITVTDTGTGVPEDIQARVFDPFFTTKEHGTGLGLSTAYGVIAQHNGSLSLSSDGTSGSTFTIILPAERATVESAPPVAAKGNLLGRGETILVAEDERPVRTIVSRILKRAGYLVLEARDGQEAVDCFNQHQGRIDLLLLDAVMPHKSGGEALAEIRQLRPGVPAVLSSGYSDILAENKELASDTTFLGKPYEPDDLLRTVRERLDAAEPWVAKQPLDG